MLETRIMLSVAILALVAGCGSPGKGNGGGGQASDHGCPGANPGIVPININYQQDDIQVNGPNQDVHEGDVLRFNLVGSDDVLVSTSGKSAPDGWLNGSGKKKANNSASERFFICVPTDLFVDDPDDVVVKEYYYNVDAVGHDRLDPVVPVRRLSN